MKSNLTYARWLFSVLLIAFVWSGSAFAQSKVVKPDQDVLSAIESAAAVFDQGQLNPTRNFRSPVCPSGNLSEGFEDLTFPPSGWVRYNPLGANQWVRSTTYSNTGSASAYITYQSTGGEDWLVTPKVNVLVGDEISFWIRHAFSSDYPPDNLAVLVSTTDNSMASFTDVIATLAVGTDYTDVFQQKSYALDAYAGQSVYIAFKHTNTDGNGIYIDDVEGPELYSPYFASDPSLDFGVTYDLGSYSMDFEIANCSAGDLELTFNSASPEVGISGLPLTVATGDVGTITVNFDPSSAGLYTGDFMINTNDPDNPILEVEVLSAVQEAVVTASIYENFDSYAGFEIPDNWIGNFSTRTTGGVNNTGRFTRNLWSLNSTGQFGTNFVDIADDGTLSFQYRIVDYSGYPSTPTPAANVDFGVYMSTDFGNSFLPLWVFDPLTHVESLDYAAVEIDLSAYSGETAIFVVDAVWNSGDFYLDFDDFNVTFVEPGLQFLVDEILMGDRPIGAWMRPASLGMINNPGRGSYTFTAVDLDNNYNGFLSASSPELPFVLDEGETTDAFGIRTNNVEATPGAYNGLLALFYTPSDRAVAVIPYSGNAYVPLEGDVWETAFDANAVTFPDVVAMGSFVNNYLLPGEDEDGWDVVYKIDVNSGDVLLDITLTADDAKMAIYASGFEGVGGPDVANAIYEGTTGATGLELFEGVYYLVVSTTGADFTLDVVDNLMPAPDAVTYLAPADGATGIINGDELEWAFGAGVIEYQLILGTTYPPATVVVDWTTDLEESYTLTTLNPNMQYFWQVNVRNNNGTTGGEVWGFTTSITPPADLTATVNDPGETSATVSATLEWTSPLDRALIGYNIYRDAVMINTDPVVGESFTDLGLARNAAYSYYVTAVFDEGESDPSNIVNINTLGVGSVEGYVFEALNNDPIEGATVRLQGANGIYTYATDADGAYEGLVYAGLYSYTVSATDYDNQTLSGQTVIHGGTLMNDFYLTESPYPVADVVAFELDEDMVQITWGGSTPPPPPPLIAEWLSYDDNGIATQYWWAGAGAPFSWAISFDPADLAELDGSSLTKIAIFNTAVADVNTLNIYQGDLEAGTATLVHTQNLTGLTLEAWNEVDLTVPVPIDVAQQLWISLYSPSPTGGVAASTPIYNAKGDWVNFTGSWLHMSADLGYDVTWSLRAFATNAANRSVTQLVSKYQEPRYNTNASASLESFDVVGAKPFRPETIARGIADYTVWREKVYQPGILEEIGNTTQLDFVDFDWATIDWGVYRWAVTANYDGGQSSIPTFSNTLDKDMEVVVDVAVTLNSNESPGGTSVTFTNISEPDLELVFNTTLDNSGLFTWNDFRRGVYDIEVKLPGYAVVNEAGVEIFDDASFAWLLEEILATPSALYVTPTAFATWEGGSGDSPFVPLMESFDGLATDELPEGWTKSPETTNWGADNSNLAGGVAPEMEFYWSPSSTDEFYLMTPVMSTAGMSMLELSFRHYVSHYNSTTYTWSLRVVAIADGVEYLIQEWNPTASIPATQVFFDLTAAHGVGASEFQIAWVFDGQTFGINYWDIDDVMLNGPRAKAGRSFENYKVFLDGQLVDETTDSEYQYDVSTLVPYETYTAGVASVFSTGQSPTAEFDFIYVPCEDYDAPSAFAAAQVEGTLDILLEWTNVDAAALDTISALRIYRNGEEYAELDFTEGAVDMFLDEDLEFGMYTYCVTYIYDSGAETCQGVTCSEEIEIDGNAAVDGMVMQAAYLGGDPIQGASVLLVNVDDPDMTFEYFTDATGAYEGSVIAGTYDYFVSAMGYSTETLEDVVIVLNATVTNNFELMEFPFPPINVVATEISDDNVLITWHNPTYAPFEPILETFDNGIPSSWTIVDGGTSTDTWYMETPAGNPQSTGASLDGTPFAFVDSDEAGSGFTLDELLISPVINASTSEELYVIFDQYYNFLTSGEYAKVDVFDGTDWVTVLNQVADAGAWNNPDHRVIDVTAYANENFQVRFHFFDNGGWTWYWAVDNVAIVDQVTRSGMPVLSNTTPPERELFGYEVYRTTCETGDLQFLGLTLDTLFNDNTWGGLEAGVYKWGVVAVYDEDNLSEMVFSNCLDKDMITQVSVTVQTNSGDLPDGTNVMFTNTSEPDLGLVYDVMLDETGYYMWEEFRKGIYDIYVAKNGFEPIEIADYLIDGPEDFVWTLNEALLPVSDLYVTPTGFATWRGGSVIPFEPFMDDFSEGIDAWTTEPATGNWQLSQTNLAGGVAPEVRFYWSPNTTNRFYFKSPVMSTLTQTELELSFDHFVDHYATPFTISVVTIADGQEYLVEEWNPTADIPANNHVVTLTNAHGVGADEFQIAFVFDGEAWNVNWWNIDNVMLYTPGTRELEYYKVWHEGLFITDTPETYYQYDVEGLGLVEGEEYLAEVAAIYSNGMSPKMSYLWTYYGCENFPGPEELTAEVNGQDVTLNWDEVVPPPPGGDGIEEDFESGSLSEGWTVEQTNTATGGPTPSYWTVNNYISTDFSPFGTYHAGLWWDYGHQDEWLITPEFNVPAGAELSFWSVVYQGSTYLDHYYVKISTDGGSTWTVLWDASTLSGGWNYYNFPYDIDLNSYAGQDVKLAFQAVDGDNQGLWYIFFVDNIVVSGESRSLAFDTESLIRQSNSANRDMYARDGNNTAIARHLNAEADADAEIRTVEMGREMWDLLYDFDMDTPSGLTGLAGAESDGEFIYATKWANNQLVKFDLDGNHIETFTIPGVTGLRDLAYDGTYFYGGSGATTVYKMDFTNHTLVSSFTAPTAVRAIAYDADNDAFWANNWATDMILFTETGTVLNTLTGMPSMYGNAYDNFSEGGPYLWFFTGTTTGGGCQVEQYNIATGSLTGVSHSVSADLGDYIAGGLYIVEDLINDKVILGGTAQGTPDIAFGYEIVDNSGGGGGGGGTIDPGVLLGANIYRNGELIAEMVPGTSYVDEDVEYGMYTYCVTFVYESGAESCFGTCVDVEVAFPCDPPKDLTGVYEWTIEEFGALIGWNSPQDAIAEWLYYDDGTNVDGIGGPASFTWAIKFDPDQLADYAGASLTKIEIYNRTAATDELRIYEGNNAATLLHSQPLSGLGIEVYETVDLTEAVLIDVTKQLWIAVYTTDGVNYPAGCGPTQNEPNGDLITLDGVLWEHLTDYALPYTWNLRGYVTNVAGATAALPMEKPVDDYSNNTEPLKITGKPSAQFAAPASAVQADRELDVFNIYRETADVDVYELIATVPFEEGVTAYSYFDTDVEAQQGYNYQVTAAYSYTNGTCESEPAMALENPEDDFVYVFITNTSEFGLNNTRVYPNPATNNVMIESAQMNRITVMNAVGQLVIDLGVEGNNTYPLNTSAYESGVYLIRIETTEGVVTKRLTIVR
ncbi:MAG: choice-of-anchor J domain-containing protein [Bacteroidales bacterium]|nr:choice-of-anchor J domain-containing protein [Bacteroidales bacterium]